MGGIVWYRMEDSVVVVVVVFDVDVDVVFDVVVEG